MHTKCEQFSGLPKQPKLDSSAGYHSSPSERQSKATGTGSETTQMEQYKNTDRRHYGTRTSHTNAPSNNNCFTTEQFCLEHILKMVTQYSTDESIRQFPLMFMTLPLDYDRIVCSNYWNSFPLFLTFPSEVDYSRRRLDMDRVDEMSIRYVKLYFGFLEAFRESAWLVPYTIYSVV